jgi:CubicO group peptidase (beta-lactamase class C family)
VNEPELAALLSTHAPRHDVPGAALGFLCDGTTTCAYHGVAADAQFPIGSLTKPMVATVVTRLACAGRLSLDDPATVHALPLDEWTFVVDAANPDTPTVTFGAFDEHGRPHVVYLMVWGFPRASG